MTFFVLRNYKTAFVLEHGIWGYLNLCSWAMATQKGCRRNCHVPFKVRAVFLYSLNGAPYKMIRFFPRQPAVQLECSSPPSVSKLFFFFFSLPKVFRTAA